MGKSAHLRRSRQFNSQLKGKEVMQVLRFRVSTRIGGKGRLVNLRLLVSINEGIILGNSESIRGKKSRVGSGEGIRFIRTEGIINISFVCSCITK